MKLEGFDSGSFGQEGYLLLRGLVPRDQACALADRYLAIRTSSGDSGDDASRVDRHDRLMQVHLWDAESEWWGHHEPLADAVARLLDDEPMLTKTIVYFKPPGSRGVALHQDERFFPLRPIVSAIVALDASDEENGRLVVVPRSHTAGLLPVESDDPARSILMHRTTLGEDAEEVGVDMQPGDVLLMHGALVHGSHPNRSADRLRRSILCIFTGQRTASFGDLLVEMAERAAGVS